MRAHHDGFLALAWYPRYDATLPVLVRKDVDTHWRVCGDIIASLTEQPFCRLVPGFGLVVAVVEARQCVEVCFDVCLIQLCEDGENRFALSEFCGVYVFAAFWAAGGCGRPVCYVDEMGAVLGWYQYIYVRRECGYIGGVP